MRFNVLTKVILPNMIERKTVSGKVFQKSKLDENLFQIYQMQLDEPTVL
jgi:hypothetical protein